MNADLATDLYRIAARSVPAVGVQSISPADAIRHRPRAYSTTVSHNLVARTPQRGSYTAYDVYAIVATYWHLGTLAGIDPVLALGQMAEETGWLSSVDCKPPYRNPAGIGHSDGLPHGVAFPDWTTACLAHVGRLLCYATPLGTEDPLEARFITEAIRWRPFPANLRGIAPTIAGLTGHWATDPDYHTKVAACATLLLA